MTRIPGSWKTFLTAGAFAVLFGYSSIAAAVFIQTGAGGSNRIMQNNRMPLAGAVLPLTPVGGGVPVKLKTGDDGEFCLAEDEESAKRSGDDDDVWVCPWLPDGRYSSNLGVTFTVKDGVATFPRWATWDNSTKVGIGVAGGLGVALIGGGGNNSSSSGNGSSGSGSSTPPAVTVTPDPVASLLSPGVTPPSWQFTHIVTVSPCPQFIVTLTVRNNSTLPVNMQISNIPGAVNVNPTTAAIPAGGSVQVTLSFNCSTTSSFAANLRVQFQAQGQTTATNVPGQGTIQNP